MTLTEILFGLLLIGTLFIEAITGFGSTVLGLPFAVQLTGLDVAVPVMVFHAWLLSAWVVATNFKKIVWQQYGTVMLFVLMGLPLGMWAFAALPETMLKLMLAMFMVAVAVHGTVRGFRKATDKTEPLSRRSRIVLYALLFLGGVIHGALATGGPLIVIYTALTIKEKGSFRATMCAVWLSLNAIMLMRFLLAGAFTPVVTRLGLVTLPFLVAGVLLGSWAHKRIPNRHFGRVIYVVLLLAGCFLAYSTIVAAL